MKITKTQLKQIIKEELSRVLREVIGAEYEKDPWAELQQSVAQYGI